MKNVIIIAATKLHHYIFKADDLYFLLNGFKDLKIPSLCCDSSAMKPHEYVLPNASALKCEIREK